MTIFPYRPPVPSVPLPRFAKAPADAERVRSLEVVNADGQVGAELTTDAHGAGRLTLFDARHVPTFAFGLGDAGAEFAMFRPNGHGEAVPTHYLGWSPYPNAPTVTVADRGQTQALTPDRGLRHDYHESAMDPARRLACPIA